MFEHDLFISYAHLDNKPLHDSRHGWIDLFHERLEIRLGQLLGKPPRIWRDPKLDGNDYFGETLLNKLSQAAIIVSVISPSYLNSEWCLKELQEFDIRAAASGGVRVDEKSRIYKVLKTPVERDDQPQELQGVLGYKFFETDQASKRFREFGHDDGPDRDKRYWEKLEDLAQDITKLIKRLNNSEQPEVTPSGKTIYIAETTSDLSEARDRIRRELQLNRHRILPDRPLSHDRRLRYEVNGYVAESQVSVHLVGAEYGIVPEGEAKSIVELQRELASERIGVSNFSQIIWMPQGISASDKRQQEYISELNNLNLPTESIIRQSKLEDLKTLIHEKLNPPDPLPQLQKATGGNGNHNPALVCIICDKPDYEAVAPIEDYLFQHGFEAFSFASVADPKTRRQCLQQCDAVLTYCGKTTDGWLQMKRIDLLKLSGSRRKKPMLAQAFYLSEPKTTGKERFRVQDALVIHNFGEFSPALLNPFIEKIKKAKGAQQ